MDTMVIFENDDFLILNKPAGLVVHGDGRTDEPSVVDWIVEQYPEIQGVGENMHISLKGEDIEINRPGIVHRIDRETSGILLVVKHQDAFEYFKKLFQHHTIEKKYLALVYGHIKHDEGVIDQPIGRHTKDFRKKMAGRDARGSLRDAITSYHVRERYKDTRFKDKQGVYERYSLVECCPKTGRTHQIRVHMKWLNHPLVADSLYEGKRKHHLPLSRVALHAHELSFVDMHGEAYLFSVEPPHDFQEALSVLTVCESHL